MKIDGISSIDLTSYYNYLEQEGLSVYFTPSVMDDKGESRKVNSSNWRGQDLQHMLDKLQLSQNKLYIIRLLKRGDLVSLLYFLNKEQLLQAMTLFPRSKLIHFINYMPKQMILKMLLWVIPLRALLQFFPTETIFNILRSKRLEVSDMVRGFENMPIEFLQQLMGEITGQKTDGLKHRELRAMFRQLSKEQIIEGMKKMQQKDLFEFIFLEVKRDPELLLMIPRGDLLKVVAMMPKPNLVELFRLVDESQLVQFLSQLPERFLELAASQLDDNLFGSILINQYPNLVAMLAEAA